MSKFKGIGKSKGGSTSKIYLTVNSYRLPIEFTIIGGSPHACKVAKSLIDELPYVNVLVTNVKNQHALILNQNT